LRLDFFDWDVAAARAENSGSDSDTVVNPKLGIAYTVNDSLELYANYGGGFHSNDVRAAELAVDPVTGDLAEPFDAIVNAVGYEGGFRAVLSDRLNFSAAVFYLELDSELIFVGDAARRSPTRVPSASASKPRCSGNRPSGSHSTCLPRRPIPSLATRLPALTAFRMLTIPLPAQVQR